MQIQDGIALRTAEVTQASFIVDRMLCQTIFFIIFCIALSSSVSLSAKCPSFL